MYLDTKNLQESLTFLNELILENNSYSVNLKIVAFLNNLICNHSERQDPNLKHILVLLFSKCLIMVNNHSLSKIEKFAYLNLLKNVKKNLK